MLLPVLLQSQLLTSGDAKACWASLHKVRRKSSGSEQKLEKKKVMNLSKKMLATLWCILKGPQKHLMHLLWVILKAPWKLLEQNWGEVALWQTVKLW